MTQYVPSHTTVNPAKFKATDGFEQGPQSGSNVNRSSNKAPQPNYQRNPNFNPSAPIPQAGKTTQVPQQSTSAPKLKSAAYYVKVLGGLYGNALKRFQTMDRVGRPEQQDVMQYWDKLTKHYYLLEQAMAAEGWTDNSLTGAKEVKAKVSRFPQFVTEATGFDPRQGMTKASWGDRDDPTLGKKHKAAPEKVANPRGGKRARPSPVPSEGGSQLPDNTPPASTTGDDDLFGVKK